MNNLFYINLFYSKLCIIVLKTQYYDSALEYFNLPNQIELNNHDVIVIVDYYSCFKLNLLYFRKKNNNRSLNCHSV